MEKLTNIIEAVLFAAGNGVSFALIAEKLNVSVAQVKKCVDELKEKYAGKCGIHLLTFNNKAQFASNPDYKDQVADVLNSIKEKEFTRAILESAAIIAYKQPITKGELEELRRVNSDYAVKTLLELQMIEPCGRKDAIGKPILYCTTDNFLKRFHISSLEELPDYETLMDQISKLSDSVEDSYLYRKDVYAEEGGENFFAENGNALENAAQAEAAVASTAENGKDDAAKTDKTAAAGEPAMPSDLPDFLRDVDDADIIRID